MKYVVTSSGKPDYYEDRVSVGDVVKYEFDFAPWLEDKGTIASVVWTVVAGGIGFTDDETTALLTFNSAGRSIVTCLVTTSTGEKKKVWLSLKAVDRNSIDDYGFNN